MRIFLSLAYRGTHYCGWQRQPGDPSVQAALEEALSTILRQDVALTGCGRTDSGVHARAYVAHCDVEGALPPAFLAGLNSLLPADIAVYAASHVHADAHARYDAYERSYEYHISLRKEPFITETSWLFPQAGRLELEKLQSAADLLPQYDYFFPFCKTHSGVDSYACALREARWERRSAEHRLVFHVTANRFLRGMVRLMVGACVNVALGKIALDDVRRALERQETLKKSFSVPPEGLALTGVRYPFSF